MTVTSNIYVGLPAWQASLSYPSTQGVARASTGTYFNSSGNFSTAAINELRINHNVTNPFGSLGNLLEGASANYIKNPTMLGATTGSPGGSPTYWSLPGTGSGLTQTIVGTGTEQGIPYMDLNYTGTASGATTVFLDFDYDVTPAGVTFANAVLSASVYFRLPASSTGFTSVQWGINSWTSGNALVASNLATSVPTAAALATQQFTLANQTMGATTSYLTAGFQINFASGAVNATLRIALPQIEPGATVTSAIIPASLPSTTGFATRAADLALIPRRVSNGSNAYQLTTPGTSAASGGPAGTGAAITDNTCVWEYLSAITYTSIPAWASGIPTTLTQPVIGQLWNCGPITTPVGTQFFNLTGHTTTSTNTITLTYAPGDSLRNSLATQTNPLAFNANLGISFEFPLGVGVTDYITVEDSFVTIKGFQFQDTYAPGSQSAIMQINTPATNVTITDCLFDGYGQGGGANLLGGNSATNLLVTNCVFIDRELVATAGDTFDNFGSVNTHFANCTFIATVGGINGNAVQMPSSSGISGTQCTNCIFIGYAAPFSNSSGSNVTLNNCLTNVASFGTGVALGSGNLTSQTTANEFVNAASDWRLKTGASAINAGSTDTADIPTADDIAGTVRPQGSAWDIGAWEAIAAGNSASEISLFNVFKVAAQAAQFSTTQLGLATDLPSPVSVIESAVAGTSITLSWTAPTTSVLLQADPVIVNPPTGLNETGATPGTISLSWAASVIFVPPFIDVDGFAAHSFTAKLSFFTITSHATTSFQNIISAIETIYHLTTAVTLQQQNFAETGVTLTNVTATGTLIKGNFASEKASFFIIGTVSTISSASGVTAADSFVVMNAVATVTSQRSVTGLASFFVITPQISLGGSALTTASDTFGAIGVIASAVTNNGASEIGTIANLTVIAVVAAIGSFVGTMTIEALSCVATAVPLQNFSAANNINLQNLGRATQFDLGSAVTSFATITDVAQLTQFVSTTASASFMPFTALAQMSTVTLKALASFLPIRAVGNLSQFKTASAVNTILTLSYATAVIPSLRSEDFKLLLADPTLLQIEADIPQTNAIQQDLASTTETIVPITGTAIAFQGYVGSATLTILPLTAAATTLEATFASATNSVNLSCFATTGAPIEGLSNILNISVGQPATPAILADPFDLILLIDPPIPAIALDVDLTIPQMIQEDIATQKNSINLTAVVVALWGNVSSAALHINLTTVATAQGSTELSGFATIPTITSIGQATFTQPWIEIANIPALSAIAAFGQSDPFNATVTVEPMSVAAVAINGNIASAAVNIETMAAAAMMGFALGAINVINFSVAGTMTSVTNATSTDTITLTPSVEAIQENLASSTDTITVSTSTSVGQTDFISGVSNFFGIKGSGVISINGAQITSNISIEIVFVAASIGQDRKMQMISQIELITESQAHLWLTPNEFVEGDQIIYWSD